MSLKAKIEAVIYASEEPVTLTQLIGLLGQEAQADLERQTAQQTLDLDLPLDPRDPIQNAEAPSSNAPTQQAEPSETPLALPPETGQEPPPAEPLPTDPATPHAAREERDRARRLRDHFRSLLDELIADYSTSARGLEVREVAGGFRLATKPEYHDAVRGFVRSLKPPLKLTLQALETLAVVAYKQPVTAPEISEIRGVDSGGVLGSLMARKLITTAGRKQVIGRPILYKTTRDFLLRFGLKDVSELPSIEEFEKMAGEIAGLDPIPGLEPVSTLEPDPVQQEIPMAEHHIPETVEDLQPERDAVAPQADGDSTPLGSLSAGVTPLTSPTPDGGPTAPPAERLTSAPPASVIPGTDDDPTESAALAREIDRDQTERTFPQTGSQPSLQPK